MSFSCRRWWCLGLVWLLVVATPVGVMRVPAQSPVAGGSAGQEAGASAKSAASPEPLEIVVLRRVDEVDRPPTAEEVESFLKAKSLEYGMVVAWQVLARQALAFQAGAALLRRSGVGFNPYLLLGGEWYPRLRAQLEREASFRAVQRLGGQAQGVWIGDTVVVPERVEAMGDLVIVARQMVVEGTEVIFEGLHHIYLFQAEPPRFMGAQTGQVKIVVKGFGQDEWQEMVRQGKCPPNCNELPGADGADGKHGANGADGTDGADGADGTCDSADTIDGRPGEAGQRGGDGEHGSDGQPGRDGATPPSITCDIPANDMTDYSFTAWGGNGGDGGTGGNGGHGGHGGNGGRGGDGASCNCRYGRGGVGGNAGAAGRGGNGGNAGRGGKGGNGGNGGDITVTYCGFVRIGMYSKPGRGGRGGGPGYIGRPGSLGRQGARPGQGSFSCSVRKDGKYVPSPGHGDYGQHGKHGERGREGDPGSTLGVARAGCRGSSSVSDGEDSRFCYYVSTDGGRTWQLLGVTMLADGQPSGSSATPATER